MKQKINVRLIGIAILAVLATLVGMTSVYYGLFQKQVRKDLGINAQVLAETGVFDKESGNISNVNISMQDLRITWIDTEIRFIMRFAFRMARFFVWRHRHGVSGMYF